MTPYNEIRQLPAGSRPPARGQKTSFETIRAIPWMFAWTQNRFILPAWLGAGEALGAQLSEDTVEIYQEMADKWPFFRGLLSMLEMVLAKASPNIALFYEERLNTNTKMAFGESLMQAFEETESILKQILKQDSLLATQNVLARSIAVRSAYILPLNFLQAELLSRIRQDLI